jgi:hypothetical protein
MAIQRAVSASTKLSDALGSTMLGSGVITRRVSTAKAIKVARPTKKTIPKELLSNLDTVPSFALVTMVISFSFHYFLFSG